MKQPVQINVPTTKKKTRTFAKKSVVAKTFGAKSKNILGTNVGVHSGKNIPGPYGRIRFSATNFAVPDDIFRASDLERHEIITSGVPAGYVAVISKRTGIPQDRFFRFLGFPKSTIEKKIKANAILGTDQSEKIVGFERIVGQVKAMVAESGNPDGFDAERWVGEWMEKPQRALGGRKPAELMNTIQGQQIVSQILGMAQSGAYA